MSNRSHVSFDIARDQLEELVTAAVENDYCPDAYAWDEVDDMSDNCPGYARGLTCTECWLEYLEVI